MVENMVHGGPYDRELMVLEVDDSERKISHGDRTPGQPNKNHPQIQQKWVGFKHPQLSVSYLAHKFVYGSTSLGFS